MYKRQILGDLYECLRAQQEEQAQELATALELYVFGSLNYLNHRTNVNVDNRVACYEDVYKRQDKVGFVWLAIGINPLYVDTGRRIESAADLCHE